MDAELEREETELGFVQMERRGRAFLERPAPRVRLVRYEGIISGGVVPALIEELETAIAAHGSVHLFVDAEELASYNTEFRRAWTAWLGANRDHLDSVHLLFRSRVVQMGVNVVNPLIGNYLTPHSDRRKFEAELGSKLDATAAAAATA